MSWSHSPQSKIVSCCHEKGPLSLGDKYPTGVTITLMVGKEVAKVTRNQAQGLEGLSADLGHCMRFPHAALEEHDKKSRGRSGANAEQSHGVCEEKPAMASASDQQPTTESHIGLMRSKRD